MKFNNVLKESLIKQVKISINHGYDLFYSLEGSAVLHRAAELGSFVCRAEPDIPATEKASSMQAFLTFSDF